MAHRADYYFRPSCALTLIRGHQVLKAYPEMDCWESQHLAQIGVAIAGVLVYCVGCGLQTFVKVASRLCTECIKQVPSDGGNIAMVHRQSARARTPFTAGAVWDTVRQVVSLHRLLCCVLVVSLCLGGWMLISLDPAGTNLTHGSTNSCLSSVEVCSLPATHEFRAITCLHTLRGMLVQVASASSLLLTILRRCNASGPRYNLSAPMNTTV
jgi:hypothetical protein